MCSGEIKSPEISDESDTSDGSFEDVPEEIPSTENEKIIPDQPAIKIEINPDEKPSKECDLFKDVFDSKVFESDQKDTKKLESKNSLIEIEINPVTKKTAQDFDMFEDVFNPQVSRQDQEPRPTSSFNEKSKEFSAIHSADDTVTENMAEKMKQSNHLYLKIASKYLVNRMRMIVEFLVGTK